MTRIIDRSPWLHALAVVVWPLVDGPIIIRIPRWWTRWRKEQS